MRKKISRENYLWENKSQRYRWEAMGKGQEAMGNRQEARGKGQEAMNDRQWVIGNHQREIS